MYDKISRELGVNLPVDLSPSGVKMSEVMHDFIQPYLDDEITKDSISSVMSMALVAWNGVMFDEQTRKELLGKVLNDIPDDMREDVLDMLEHMMDRKRRLFFDYKNYVFNFEIMEKNNKYQLLVASTPAV